jgi:hypothetical protein
MIGVDPRRLIIVQEAKKATTLQLSTGRLYQEGAPSTRTNDRVNFFNQVLR